MQIVRGAVPTLLAGALSLLTSAFSAAAQDKAKIDIVPLVPHAVNITTVAFSPDDAFVLSGSQDWTLKLWDVASGKLVRTFDAHSSLVTSVSFSPDGARILSGSRDKTIKLWDAATGTPLRTFEGHSDGVNSVAFSPDDAFVLSGSSDKLLKLWDATTGTLLRTFEGHADGVNSVAFLPDGRSVLSGSSDKTLKLWDAATGTLLRTFEGHTDKVNSVAFSPDSRRILSGSSDKTLKLWDAATGTPLRTFEGHSDGVNSVAFSPDGRRILSGSSDKTLKLWDVTNGKPLLTIDGHSDPVTSVAFSPDGTRLISGGGAGISSFSQRPNKDNSVKLWDAASGQPIGSFEGYSSWIWSTALSPDGTRLAWATGDKSLKLWDVATCQLIRTLSGHSDEVRSVAFSPDGKHLASGSGDKTIKLWDVVTGKLVRTLEGHTADVSSVAFSPDGARVLSGSADKTIKLWETNSGALLRTFEGHAGAVNSVAFSPDGATLVSSSTDRSLMLLDIATGQFKRLLGHTDDVRSAVFSPNGTKVLSASTDGTLMLWDVATGQRIQTLEEPAAYAAIFSPDGLRLLSGSEYGTLKLWDAATGTIIRVLEAHTGAVSSVAFLPDGRRLLSSSNDTTGKFWSAATGEPLVSLLASRQGDWLAITPEGFFAGSPKGSDMLGVVRGLEVFGIDQFYQALYRPDLVQEKRAGDLNGKVREAAAQLDLAKLIESGRVPAVRFDKTELVSPTDIMTLAANLADQGGGIGRAEWRINGITIGVADKPGSTTKQTVALDPGENVIELVAYNGANLVASRPARAKVVWNGAEPTARPRLFVLVAGINNYLDGALKLNLAVPDAKAIATAFKEAGREHYDEVNVSFALDTDATVAGLDRIFADLATKVRPRDVFVFFAAGHGKTVDGRYYLVPQDLIYKTDQSLIDQGIDQDRLQKWFASIRAKKAILIFDTCEAGTLTTMQRVASRGLEQKAALGRLIQATGRATLTASTATQSAYEGYGGHGVFTFAILDALAHADTNGNGLIELAELVQHVDGLVPAITEKKWRAKQFPQMDAYGSNFSLARQVASLAPSEGDDIVIPIKPTHVNTEQLAIFKEAGGKGQVVQQLPPLTSVTLVKTEKGWVLIAKDGKLLGYVAEASLHKLN